ncbi:MAG: hypothetical protein DIU62_010915 [Pseudomonadota bacterium]|jgi:hypothetical protein
MKSTLNRRELIALSGGAVMAATAATAAATRSPSSPVGPDVAGADVTGAGRTVILQDRRLELPLDLRERLQMDGAALLTLEPDPVRMWRGEHAALLQDPGTRLMGVTPWVEFLMVRGLAAESRKRVRYQRFDADSNAVVWLIA